MNNDPYGNPLTPWLVGAAVGVLIVTFSMAWRRAAHNAIGDGSTDYYGSNVLLTNAAGTTIKELRTESSTAAYIAGVNMALDAIPQVVSNGEEMTWGELKNEVCRRLYVPRQHIEPVTLK